LELKDTVTIAQWLEEGRRFLQAGRIEDAAAAFRLSLRVKPDLAEAWQNLGVALHGRVAPEEEATYYRRALHLAPYSATASFGLGNILLTQGRNQEAIQLFRQALVLRPNDADLWNNLGNLLNGWSRIDAAMNCFRRAIWLRPDQARAHFNLGNALRDGGAYREAAEQFRQALRLDPGHGKALAQLVNVLRIACDWRDISGQEIALLAQMRQGRGEAPPIFPLFLKGATPADHLRSARQWALNCAQNVAILPSVQRHRPRNKIRLGYLSADFRNHPVAILVAELFERHDRTRFHVAGYSIGPNDQTPIQKRLESSFDKFLDLRPCSHAKAASAIRADEIDILIDLTGYTQYARPQIPAARPAPIQVNFLGFPGTMGADYFDYIIADRFVLPMDQSAFFTEKIVHLPGCYQPNDSQRLIREPPPGRKQCGLPETGFVFCCFNNSFKITPEIFAIWMRLLLAVPDSVLWLLEANAAAIGNLRREALARGVATERLIFAPRLPLPDHLARHRHADLFLDTLPYNAHTTASDALWAGLPVVTCAGLSFAGRVAGSLLRAVGLPELITNSLADYENLALRLVTDPILRTSLRQRLAETRKTSPLFDGALFARPLERAFERMCQRFEGGLLPEAFVI
jgi:predicted O-linked N-acetylglucosamine transferase (SPINDLY family)